MGNVIIYFRSTIRNLCLSWLNYSSSESLSSAWMLSMYLVVTFGILDDLLSWILSGLSRLVSLTFLDAHFGEWYLYLEISLWSSLFRFDFGSALVGKLAFCSAVISWTLGRWNIGFSADFDSFTFLLFWVFSRLIDF